MQFKQWTYTHLQSTFIYHSIGTQRNVPMVCTSIESYISAVNMLRSTASSLNVVKLPMWAKTGRRKKLQAHKELWTWVWPWLQGGKPYRASATISFMLIRQKCANMVEMHTGPELALEVHHLHKNWSYEVKEIDLLAHLLPPSTCWIKMYEVQSRRFWAWLLSWCCWSDRVKDASDSPQTPGSPSGEPPATHAVVTHHSWQRRRVRARRCGGNIITKTILGWHLPPPLWRKMGENKHSQWEKL